MKFTDESKNMALRSRQISVHPRLRILGQYTWKSLDFSHLLVRNQHYKELIELYLYKLWLIIDDQDVPPKFSTEDLTCLRMEKRDTMKKQTKTSKRKQVKFHSRKLSKYYEDCQLGKQNNILYQAS